MELERSRLGPALGPEAQLGDVKVFRDLEFDAAILAPEDAQRPRARVRVVRIDLGVTLPRGPNAECLLVPSERTRVATFKAGGVLCNSGGCRRGEEEDRRDCSPAHEQAHGIQSFL